MRHRKIELHEYLRKNHWCATCIRKSMRFSLHPFLLSCMSGSGSWLTDREGVGSINQCELQNECIARSIKS